jgi:RNA polymerase-associated protein RTF1
MSDFEDDIDDQLLELAGATEKKKKRRQHSNSNGTNTMGGSGGNKKRKAEYAFTSFNSDPILLGVVIKTSCQKKLCPFLAIHCS